MIKEGKIGVRETVWLVSFAIGAKVFFTSPSILAGLVGNTGWYTTIISGLVALLGFSFIYFLLKRFPDKNIMEIFDITFGKIIGFIFSGFLAVYMFYLANNSINELTEVLRIYSFPLTPNWYVNGLYVLCIFFVCMLGLESISRFTVLLAIPMLVGFIIVLILGFQNYDVNHLFPILGKGLDKTLLQGLLRSSTYGEVIILAVFASSLQGAKFIKKEGIIGISIACISIALSVFCYTLTFPYYISSEITAPMYELAAYIDYGRYAQRVEPIFLVNWILSNLISVTIIFYSFIIIFCNMFKIEDKKPILISGCILLYAVVLIEKDFSKIIYSNVQLIRTYGWIPSFILPLIALIVSLIRKKGGKPNA